MTRMKCLALAAAAALATSGVAGAATTAINPTPHTTEINLNVALALAIARAQSNTNVALVDITGSFGTLGALSGTLTGSVSIPSLSLTYNYQLVRVSDNPLGPALNIDGSNYTTATDQIWQDGTISFVATARYAGAALTSFGIRVGNTGTETVNPILTATSNALGTPTTFGPVAAPGQFTLQAQSTGSGSESFSSLESVNSLGFNSVTAQQVRDQFVTFALLLETSPSVYTFDSFLVAFEDRRSSDYDFNDLIVQLRGPGAGAEIPLPSAALAGSALLGGILLRRRVLSA
ncbi:MAG: DUF4114 domain-containing protein [Tepidisphaerales bacterium]